MFPLKIETDRLVLEKLSHDRIDLQSYYQVCSIHEPGIEDVVEHIPGFEPHHHPKQTKDFIDEAEELWESGEKAEYIIRPKEGEPKAGEIAGGARLSVDWEKQTGDLGIWLRKQFWGQGYSEERASALMEVAFEQLDLKLVQAICIDGNENSRRAVERYIDKYGGTYEGLLRNWMVNSSGETLDCHRYTITKREYNSSATTATR